MSLLANMPGPGLGLFPNQYNIRVKNVTTSAMVAGSLARLDFTMADAETVSTLPGHMTAGQEDSSFFNIVLPERGAASPKRGQYVILLQDLAAGATGLACVTGVVPAIVWTGPGGGATSWANGESLGLFSTTNGSGIATNIGALGKVSTLESSATGTGANFVGGEIVRAIFLHSASSSATSNTVVTMSVWFCGVGAGFGQNAQ